MPGPCQRLRLPSLASVMRNAATTTTTVVAPTRANSTAGGGAINGTADSVVVVANGAGVYAGSGHHATRTSTASQIRKEQRRVVVLGGARVGKTCIVSQFLYDKFHARYKQTVEELHRGEYDLPDGQALTLDILDTSGSFEFPAMRTLSISTAGAFILVYAVDDVESWHEVERLRNQIISARGLKVPIVVVANKIDLNEVERRVEREVTEMVVCEDWKCGYIECSAKENVGIVEIFKELLVQANIRYNLSPAVRRRRQSLPAFSSPKGSKSPSHKYTLKRHSCTMT